MTLRVTKNIRRQSGTSFIEIIVATAILAIGMLGVAHLQVSGARFNTGSYARTQATVLASSILDEIRTHGADVADEFGTAVAGTCDPLGTSPNDSVACWLSELGDTLPGGDGEIDVVNDATGTHVSVTINWTEVRMSNNDAGDQTGALQKSLVMEADI